MPLRINLHRRRRVPEIMDQPDLAEGPHRHALRGLERINFWSGSAGILWPGLSDLARRAGPVALRLLDVATGAGDVPIRLWHKARRAGIPLEIEGCDISPCAVEFARRRAEQSKAAVQFFAWDALNDPFPGGYDVVTSSLFLHHLGDDQAECFLRRMAGLARQLVLVNDLRRGLAGFLLACVATRVLSSSPVVHTDGPRSVKAAFTPDEVFRLARKAGLEGATVERRWPCRFLLTWRRHQRSEVRSQKPLTSDL